MVNNTPSASAWRLVVRVSRSSLSFTTASIGGVSHEAYPLNSSISMAANLREALRTVPMLKEPYDRTLVMVDTPVLMIPMPLFREDDYQELYRYTFCDTAQQVVMHSVLPDLNSVAVFAVQKDIRTVVGDAFGRPRYMPVMASVWRHLHQRSYTGQRGKLFVYFHERQMEVMSFVQNRFRFCNAYTVNNPNDAIFYMLSVWKQTGLDAERDELHLVGDMADAASMVAELEKFVKRVYLIIPSGEFNRAPITQIPDVPYDLVTLFVKGV